MNDTSPQPVPADPKPTPILVADDDPVVLSVLRKSLTLLGYEPICVEDGEEAIEVLQGPTPPQIAIVDWMMPNKSGLDVVRHARMSGRPPTYFLLLTAKDATDLGRAFEAGVDDVLIKPVVRRELETRLAVARSAVSRGRADVLTDALREALSDAEGSGEIIVSGRDTTGRIHVDEHRIVWVRVLPEPMGIGRLLESELGLAVDEVRAVVEECRRTRRTFDAVVVEWKLATLDRLRDCLRQFFSGELSTLRALHPVRAAFFPGSAKTDSAIRFSLEEVAPWAITLAALKTTGSIPPPPAQSPPSSNDLAGRQMAALEELSGLEAVFLLDIRTGTVVAAHGNRGLVESAWALTRALEHVDRESDEAPEEMTSATRNYYFLVNRTLSSRAAKLAMVIAIDRSKGNFAMSRLELARACEIK